MVGGSKPGAGDRYNVRHFRFEQSGTRAFRPVGRLCQGRDAANCKGPQVNRISWRTIEQPMGTWDSDRLSLSLSPFWPPSPRISAAMRRMDFELEDPGDS